VFKQAGNSGKVPIIDLSLSSNEENFIADTSRDVEFAKKLFGDLNRDILGPSGDGKVIILNDCDEEKEAHEEKIAGTESTPTSVAVNPASTASTNTDDAPVGAKNDNSDDQGADQEAGGSNNSRGGVSEPEAVAPKTKVLRQACLKDAHGSALLFFHLLCARELGWWCKVIGLL
jgi:hypothetical protein